MRSNRTMEHTVSRGDICDPCSGHSKLFHLHITCPMPMSTELYWTHNAWVFSKTQSECKYRTVDGQQLPSLGLHSKPSPKECERKQHAISGLRLHPFFSHMLSGCRGHRDSSGWQKYKTGDTNQESQQWPMMWVRNESLVQITEMVGFLCYCSSCSLGVYIFAEL